MKSYEVEIKSLLGSVENAEKLKKNLATMYPNIKEMGKGKQLNHYFNTPKDLLTFGDKISALIPAEKKEEFEKVLEHGEKMSIRTRDADGKVIFVIKASVGDDTSSNGVRRVEFEIPVAKSLDELDRMLIDAGCTYQAKWSRERQEYAAGDLHVCIDKNAGYGYLAEFEKVVTDMTLLDETHAEIESIMNKLGFEELPQDRLERMFAFYNAHWPEYYGTEKTFSVQ